MGRFKLCKEKNGQQKQYKYKQNKKKMNTPTHTKEYKFDEKLHKQKEKKKSIIVGWSVALSLSLSYEIRNQYLFSGVPVLLQGVLLQGVRDRRGTFCKMTNNFEFLTAFESHS